MNAHANISEAAFVEYEQELSVTEYIYLIESYGGCFTMDEKGKVMVDCDVDTAEEFHKLHARLKSQISHIDRPDLLAAVRSHIKQRNPNVYPEHWFK